MNTQLIYLDNSATTQALPEVLAAMSDTLREGYFNPSALYAQALDSEKRMDSCRNLIKQKLQCDRVIFTSGGTEANNLAILGQAFSGIAQKGRVLYSEIEHPSVKEACLSLKDKADVCTIPVQKNGLIDLEALKSLMTPQTRLICVMQVNNETGAVQALETISQMRLELCPDAKLHVDGVQGFLRLPLSMKALKVDSYSLSAHKIHGPKGIGALALNHSVKIQPMLLGGGQEAALRSGTQNTPGIAGLNAAMVYYPLNHHMASLKHRLATLVMSELPLAELNGPDLMSAEAAPHILNLSFPPVRAETLLHALEAEGVLVGNGSACSSKKNKGSATLIAMGKSHEALDSAIRFSLNPFLSEDQIDQAAAAVIRCYKRLKNFKRR